MGKIEDLQRRFDELDCTDISTERLLAVLSDEFGMLVDEVCKRLAEGEQHE